MQNKSVYQEQNIQTNLAIFLLSSLMIGFSLYLTQHYFDIKFPTGLESKAFCNLNQFFNCDKTTLSLFGNIFGVPIALFGALIGIFALLGMVFKNEKYESTIYFILWVNFIGCLLLFFYSLFVLKGLCPICALYYLVSGLMLFCFFKKSPSFKPNIGYLLLFSAIVLLVAGTTKMNINTKEKAQGDIASDLIKQYYSLPNLGEPKTASPFKIASATNAPLNMIIFSDFECPACKILSELLPKIIARYQDKIDIQYFFYPLDSSCNPNMERPMHQNACKAAFAATCMATAEFYNIHDEFFKNQEKFDSGFVDQFIKNNKLEACVANAVTKEKVVALINAATPFNIRSTPTFLLNGVKIEGVLPSDQMFAIMDEILKRSGK